MRGAFRLNTCPSSPVVMLSALLRVVRHLETVVFGHFVHGCLGGSLAHTSRVMQTSAS